MPFFKSDKATLHYYELGEGEEIMLAFHGFGMRGTQFNVLEPALKAHYKIYSFDLFFHGQTVLLDSGHKAVKSGYKTSDIAALMQDFLVSIGAADQKFSLLSYSMGSLMAWSLVHEIPQRINAVFFIAPDGIRPNKLLGIGARNGIVNRLFNYLVYSPRAVHFLLNNLFRFRYIDESLHRILKQEFGTTETRLTCYNAITYNAQLVFNPEQSAKLINHHQINTYLYFGRTDKLFPSVIGEKFVKLLDHANLHIFEDGHELINQRLNDLLTEQLALHKHE